MPKTNIVATLGPSSSTEAILRKMFMKGLDMVRLNFSHGTRPEHLDRIRLVRLLNKKMRRRIKIMQDLEGYRVRIGDLKSPVVLKKRSAYYLTQEAHIEDRRDIPFDYDGPINGIRPGALIFIDDGRVVLKVKKRYRRRLEVRSQTAGILTRHKGINIPDADLDFPRLTEKDQRDVRVAVEQRLDYVAQSFVRDEKDIRALRDILDNGHPGCRIFAKIENRTALGNIDRILDETHGIIVARGDLGICVPIYKVPAIQKELIKMCRLKGKPVIVATQMLESMTTEPLPTRAEVSDTANAILDGATHLMLSGETAVGAHPDKVVDMMNKVIRSTEEYQKKLGGLPE